jgi:hypothetical protein
LNPKKNNNEPTTTLGTKETSSDPATNTSKQITAADRSRQRSEGGNDQADDNRAHQGQADPPRYIWCQIAGENQGRKREGNEYHDHADDHADDRAGYQVWK